MVSRPDLARRAGTLLFHGVVPAVVGGTVLLLAGVSAWPPWLAVLAVAVGSGVVSVHRAALGSPPPPPAADAERAEDAKPAAEPLRLEMPMYAMLRPLRTVPAQGIPADARYTVEVSTRTQLAVVVAPSETVGPTAHWVPASGHNVTLTLTAPTAGTVTVRQATAELLARTPFPGPVGVSLAARRMPDLVLSPDLLESLQRSVAAYRPLATPDATILLDAEPVKIARLRPVTPVPWEVPAGATVSVVFAPVTTADGWVRWRLRCEIESDGRVDTVHWDLMVTAATGMAEYAPGGDAPARMPVHQLYPDHWDPVNDSPDRPLAADGEQEFEVVGHMSADGRGLLTGPARPASDPESVEAVRLRETGDSHAAGGRWDAAADAYRRAADAGSGPAAYTLGLLRQRQGDLDEARRWFVVAAGRRFFLAFNNVAATLLALGDGEQAEWWFRRAMDEGDWTAAVNLGVLQARGGRLAEAEVLLRAASRVDVPRAAEMLAYVLIDQGRLDEAEQVLVRDATRSTRGIGGPDEPAYRRVLRLAGFLLDQRGDLTGGLATLRTVVDDDSAPPEAVGTVAATLDRLTVDLIRGARPGLADAVRVGVLRVEVHRRLFALDPAARHRSYDRALTDLVTLASAAGEPEIHRTAAAELLDLRGAPGTSG